MEEQVSQLDSFLKRQQEGGSSAEAGYFTMDVEVALRKMAAFQLPFEGAWILKVVQFAVAGGCEVGIRLEITSSNTRLFFDLPPKPSYRELTEALANPSPHEWPPMRELVLAMRATALNQGRPFLLSLPWEPDVLIWDGQAFTQEERTEKYDCFALTVSHSGREQSGWIKRYTANRRENAALTREIHRRAFPCPVPLTLDRRRVDSLMMNPEHGLTKTSFPYTVRWHSHDKLATWIPPRDPLVLPNNQNTAYFPGFEKFVQESLHAHGFPEKTSMAQFLCAHFKLEGREDRHDWKTTESFSRVYWLRHGVLVDSETLFERPTAISMAIYLSAEGLETDLTGFQLRRTAEKDRRLELALSIIDETLPAESFQAFLVQQEDSRRSLWFSGGGGAVAGAFLVGMKLLAIPAALALGAFSAVCDYYSSRKNRTKAMVIGQGLEALKEQFKNR